MLWVLFVVLQFSVVAAGFRRERQTGQWSWSKLVFAIGFALLESVIVCAPIYYVGLKSPYFIPVFAVAWVIAALNFIWMIIVARRWKLPDGRTSLEAYRHAQRAEEQSRAVNHVR